MSDLRFDDYAAELSELFTTEDTCLGCLADEPDQHAHMGFGGCLADHDHYHYDNTALPETLSDTQLAALRDSVVPEGVRFYINGHLVPPGMAMSDALSAFGDGNDGNYDEGDECGEDCDDDDDGCQGCLFDSMTRSDHTGVNGCLSDYGGCC